MPAPRFVQIHSLASYPGTLLNRDDTGLAKRLPFGGVVRARVSSQALKRKWRFAGEADHDAAARAPHSLQSLKLPMGDRSKDVVKHAVLPAALAGQPVLHEAAVAALTDALNVALYGKNGADSKSRQALFFGHPEIEYVKTVARGLVTQAVAQAELLASASKAADKKAIKVLEDTLKEALAPLQKNLRSLAQTTTGAAGLESALFGRMVTSDTEANVNAPVHVAHAFTVHGIEQELDYVTAVDDLRQRSEEAEAGSAGIFDIELTSGLFYSYVVIDVALLVSNLNDDADTAGAVCERLLQLIARTSPGAKKGSTAPYAHAEFMLVETGDDQPRTLANAFRKPVSLNSASRDVFGEAIRAMQTHLAGLDAAYGVHTQRHQLSATEPPLHGVEQLSLAALCESLRQRVAG